MSTRNIFCQSAFAIVLVLMTTSSAAAQALSSTRELRVAVIPIPPFVMQEKGSLTGFNVDFWNTIAAQLQLKTDYQVLPDIASLLESMRSKNADVVVSPIVITTEEIAISLSPLREIRVVVPVYLADTIALPSRSRLSELAVRLRDIGQNPVQLGELELAFQRSSLAACGRVAHSRVASIPPQELYGKSLTLSTAIANSFSNSPET